MSPSFAEKTKKAAQKNEGDVCPECGEEVEIVKYIRPVDPEDKNSLKFKNTMIKVCDCNKEEIYQ